MSVKRVRPPRPTTPPIDDRFVYVPVGADALDADDWKKGYAAFEFPCHPTMLAGLQLDVGADHQVWEQICPQCGRAWRFTRGEQLIRWEPIDALVDPSAEPTLGVDAWQILVDRYRTARQQA